MDDRPSTDHLLPRRALVRANGPLYAQVADILRDAIAGGGFPVGSDLPKEAVIAERFGVSLITVRQALRDLAADGLIQKRSAKPAVVASLTPTVNLSWNFKNFADVRREVGGDLRLLLVADLDIREGAPVLAVEMLYQTADQRNIELSTARHPAELFSITYDLPNDLN